MVEKRGGLSQLCGNSSAHSAGGRLESSNGMAYRALPLVPSFFGSVTLSITTLLILMSVSSGATGFGSKSFVFEAVIVEKGFPIGGSSSRDFSHNLSGHDVALVAHSAFSIV